MPQVTKSGEPFDKAKDVQVLWQPNHGRLEGWLEWSTPRILSAVFVFKIHVLLKALKNLQLFSKVFSEQTPAKWFFIVWCKNQSLASVVKKDSLSEEPKNRGLALKLFCFQQEEPLRWAELRMTSNPNWRPTNTSQFSFARHHPWFSAFQETTQWILISDAQFLSAGSIKCVASCLWFRIEPSVRLGRRFVKTPMWNNSICVELQLRAHFSTISIAARCCVCFKLHELNVFWFLSTGVFTGKI